MIICCSLYDIKKYGRGRIFRTSTGDKSGMGEYAGLEFLYPGWDLVMGHKRHVLSDQQYRDGYKALLGSRWSEVDGWLKGLVADGDITLLCYCKEGEFCHRRQIASMIKAYRPDLAHLVEVH